MGKFKELTTGTKFNRLTLISALPKIEKRPSGRKKYLYECQCDCGKVVWLTRQDITTGHTKSCGCYRKDLCSLSKEQWAQAGFMKLFSDYKSAAKSRNLLFALSKEEFKQLTAGTCVYCGLKPSLKREHGSKNPLYGSYTYNGIDRINSSIGYIFNNCVTACNRCNIAKKDYSPTDFLAWIEKVYKYQKGN